jgi:hypothetical protein
VVDRYGDAALADFAARLDSLTATQLQRLKEPRVYPHSPAVSPASDPFSSHRFDGASSPGLSSCPFPVPPGAVR